MGGACGCGAAVGGDGPEAQQLPTRWRAHQWLLHQGQNRTTVGGGSRGSGGGGGGGRATRDLVPPPSAELSTMRVRVPPIFWCLSVTAPSGVAQWACHWASSPPRAPCTQELIVQGSLAPLRSTVVRLRSAVSSSSSSSSSSPTPSPGTVELEFLSDEEGASAESLQLVERNRWRFWAPAPAAERPHATPLPMTHM
jgi:hypothetical protein